MKLGINELLKLQLQHELCGQLVLPKTCNYHMVLWVPPVVEYVKKFNIKFHGNNFKHDLTAEKIFEHRGEWFTKKSPKKSRAPIKNCESFPKKSLFFSLKQPRSPVNLLTCSEKAGWNINQKISLIEFKISHLFRNFQVQRYRK